MRKITDFSLIITQWVPQKMSFFDFLESPQNAHFIRVFGDAEKFFCTYLTQSDELGRVVIPKEIRRTQRIRQGDALEIFTAADGQVVFKKYSPLVELGELAGVYAEVLAKNLGRPVLVCDRESIVAATGTGKGQLLGRQISDAAARLLAMRGPYTAPEAAARRITAFDKGETVLLCVCPIVVQGDVEGGVLLTGRPQDAAPDTETARAVNIAAAFLAKWMEE